jgi:hypothetical protein
MALGKLIYGLAVFIQVLVLIAVIIVAAAWFINEHDKRANYYKRQLQLCLAVKAG